MRLWHPVLLLAVLGAGACSFDFDTNPNSPDPIGQDPSRAEVSAAANGMLIAFREDFADFALDMGIIGREVYRFDGSDPRYNTELLHGPLDAGSRAYGGDHWADEYAAIRGGNLLLEVLPTATSLSDPERSATTGYVKTIQALAFLLVLNSHTQDQIPIDVGTDVTAPPAPFVTNVAAYDRVVGLLDGAKTDLEAAGTGAFPFALPSGFAGFDTPATFIKFNRALRARVAAYRQDYAGALVALGESFVDDAGDLNLGVYMNYGTGPGDLANPLAIDPQRGENFAHPSLETGVQFQADGTTPDQRFLDKIVKRTITTVDDLTSDLGWIRYPSPSTPIPIIKKEELVLLRAEARIAQGDLAGALTDINTVRTTSGRLQLHGGFANQTEATDELLYNRLYSLMYEGAHRWIDARRFGRLNTLPIDRPTPTPPTPPDVVFSTLLIPTDEVLARQ